MSEGRPTYRRVVSANVDGKSTVVSDEEVAANEFEAVPGFIPNVVWGTIPGATLDSGADDKSVSIESVLPEAGGTKLFLVTFPPDAVMTAATFDPEAAGAEYLAKLPELAECFEQDNPGMHRTSTIDYDVVLDGEIVCEFDDGEAVRLKRGDILIQHGTRHAWRNPGDNPATMIFVLVGT